MNITYTGMEPGTQVFITYGRKVRNPYVPNTNMKFATGENFEN